MVGLERLAKQHDGEDDGEHRRQVREQPGLGGSHLGHRVGPQGQRDHPADHHEGDARGVHRIDREATEGR